MKKLFTCLFFSLFSIFSFSQVITFECNNEIIVVSFDEISDNPNAYMDWDGDGLINETDYLIYLLEVYGCNNEDNDWGDDSDDGDDEDNDWGDDSDDGDDENNDWGDVFTFECNGEEITIELTDLNMDIESYIDSIISDYDCSEWNEDNDWGDDSDDGDNEDNDWGDDSDDGDDEDNDWNVSDIDWSVSDWENFSWDIYWDEFDLNNIDWENIIWDMIIELDISPEDFIDYVISIIAEGQPFNWDDFISEMQGGVDCEDYDDIVSTGLSIWTDVDGCVDALVYINSLGFNCFTELNMPFVSADNVTLSELCCETCEEITNEIEGCTDINACNYDSEATVDDGTCGLLDDCGDCQIPYCYIVGGSVSYVAQDDCNSIWIGSDCDNNQYCLSSPENVYWNSGCVSIEENPSFKEIQYITNLLGQEQFDSHGIQFYFYENGQVQKKYIIK